jgi:hypothetical protein
MNRIVDLHLRNCSDYYLPAQPINVERGSSSDDSMIATKGKME